MQLVVKKMNADKVKPRILYISSVYQHDPGNSYGCFITQQVEKLARYNEAAVISPVPVLPRKSDILHPVKFINSKLKIPSSYTAKGIRVDAPKYFRLPRKPFKFTEGGIYYRAVSKVFAQADFKPDLIHSYRLYPDSFAASKLAGKLSIPHVVSIIGSDFYFLDKPLIRGPAESVLKNASAIIIQNQREKNRLSGLLGDLSKVYMINNGIDSDRFSYKADSEVSEHFSGSEFINTSDYHILYVGHLVKLKRVDVLIKAFEKFKRKVSKARLIIIGEGHQLAELKKLASQPDISGSIHFLGDIEQKELPYWYNLSNCFVLPSISEGCPNVVMEALACGVPVIGSDIAGTSGLVKSISGLLFQTDNINDLALKLEEVYHNQWDREQIAAKAAKVLNKEERIGKINRIYEDLISSGVG